MFSAIIFDCDGVLINSETILMRVYRRRLAGLGLDYSPSVWGERFKGRTWPHCVALIGQDYHARFGAPLPGDAFSDIRERVQDAYRQELAPTPGIVNLLEALTLPKAVASNSEAASLDSKLRHTGLAGYFSPHLNALDHVARGKPAPDLYLHAAGRLGAAPGECLVIEDSITGVTAARAAGMTCWGYTGEGGGDNGLPERLRAAGAAETFASHDDIRARLGSLALL